MGREVSWLKAFHLNRKVHSFQKPLSAHPGLSTEPSYKGSSDHWDNQTVLLTVT